MTAAIVLEKPLVRESQVRSMRLFRGQTESIVFVREQSELVRASIQGARPFIARAVGRGLFEFTEQSLKNPDVFVVDERLTRIAYNRKGTVYAGELTKVGGR